MADTYTTNYNLTKPGVGGDPDSWGTLLNNNFDAIDTALHSATQTASTASSTASAAQSTANAAQTAANSAQAAANAALPIAGGTLTGQIILSANPTAALAAAPKQYVDAATGALLPKAGGTMTGMLAISGAAQTYRQFMFQTGAQPRMLLGLTNAAESGSNAGSDLFLNMYDDTGAYLNQPFSINRASGRVTFAQQPQWAGVAPWDSGNLPTPASAGQGFTMQAVPGASAFPLNLASSYGPGIYALTYNWVNRVNPSGNTYSGTYTLTILAVPNAPSIVAPVQSSSTPPDTSSLFLASAVPGTNTSNTAGTITYTFVGLTKMAKL